MHLLALHSGESPCRTRVANLVTFLASDLAFFVNGTTIEIDGEQEKPLMDRLRDR